MALVPSGAQQWMWAAVVFDVKPLNATLSCSVGINGLVVFSVTVAAPVPAGLTGGTSFAPERINGNVNMSARAGTDDINAALKQIAESRV
jgi:hypothetical protein